MPDAVLVCMCDFPSHCGGDGVLTCIGCGGGFCACAACYGNGEMECDGCGDCDDLGRWDAENPEDYDP